MVTAIRPSGVGTSSKVTRRLGAATLVVGAIFLAYALVISPPDVSQGESVRLFYIHVPAAIVSLYLAFGVTALGSIIYLRKRSQFWDLVAWASAEIGVLFCAFTLVTGMLWGRPTWGVYWTWDARLTSTAITFILFLGYLAVRRLDMPADVRSQRAAVLGIISFLNVIVVRYSVQWWRGLHQQSTLDPTDIQIDDTMLFSFFLGAVFESLVFAWLVVHRFRVGWLETQIEAAGIDAAIEERRDEGVQEGNR